MAGIGFELRKVIGRGGLASFLQTAMSGAMIVAGPWILSIITISAIQTFLGRRTDTPELFMGIMIYSYAFSLAIFGGFHYIFTRRMSDLLYLEKEQQALGYVLLLCIPIIIISILLSAPAAFVLIPEGENPALFLFSVILLFVSINCLWIIMLYVSVLKWYIKIMLSYGGGLVCSIAFIYLLSENLGLSGAVMGFALGHILIVMLLLSLCLKANRPARPEPPAEIENAEKKSAAGVFISYLTKHRFLFAAGVFYYLGIWIDKFVFWVFFGENISGSFIRLFPEYDIAVYLGNLTMIPGLVFFVVYSETTYYTALKKFLYKLGRANYSMIVESKKNLRYICLNYLREQSVLQGVFTLVAVASAGGMIMRTAIGAVFFHLLLLTLLNYLFYMEHYRHAFTAALIFFTTNLVLAVVSGITNMPQTAGFSYLIGAFAASVCAFGFLLRDIHTLDRHILTKK